MTNIELRLVSMSLVVALAILTWRQAGIYRDVETLWRDTLKKNAAAVPALSGLGILLTEQQRYAEAEHHLREIVRFWPDDGFGWCNLAVVLMRQGQLQEALDACRRGRALVPDSPIPYNCEGSALQLLQQLEDAAAAYEMAVGRAPEYVEARYNLARVYELLDRPDDAMVQYRGILNVQPVYADVAARLKAIERH